MDKKCAILEFSTAIEKKKKKTAFAVYLKPCTKDIKFINYMNSYNLDLI